MGVLLGLDMIRLEINWSISMNVQKSALVPIVTPVANEGLIFSYMQTIKDVKAQSQEDLRQLSIVLKGRNNEVRILKGEAEIFKQHIDKHNKEFKKFRGVLSDLKTLALEGKLTSDVIHGPEILSLNKENEKLTFLYAQECERSEKFEARSQAMSSQIIARQKKIYQLEALLLESDKQKSYLELLLKPAEAVESDVRSAKRSLETMFRNLFDSMQKLPSIIPGWLKT